MRTEVGICHSGVVEDSVVPAYDAVPLRQFLRDPVTFQHYDATFLGNLGDHSRRHTSDDAQLQKHLSSKPKYFTINICWLVVVALPLFSAVPADSKSDHQSLSNKTGIRDIN
jgi:hypothetical protein